MADEQFAARDMLVAHHDLGGVAVRVVEDLVETGELVTDQPAWAAAQLLGMLDRATLVLGLTTGDEAEPPRPLADICADAVETFLARYGTKTPLSEGTGAS